MTFEDLEAWKSARELTQAVYGMTRSKVISQDFRLCSQIQAASVSSMSNIAEGFERTSIPEKLQFYKIARGSSGEVRSLLYVIEDCYIDLSPSVGQLRDLCSTTGKLISGLINSTESRRTDKR